MQEESGSVESVENTVEEGQSAPKKKASKKKPSIPTVEAVVAAEKSEEAQEAESVESEGKAQIEENVPDAVEQKSEPEKDEKKDAVAETEADSSDDELSDEEKAEIERRRSEMNLDNETALLETVLFLESEPQPVETLSKITQLAPDVVEDCVKRLKDKYANTDSGIELSQIIGGWILTPKKECFDLVKERYGKKNEGRLSKAAIETLSIIAYSQPITRAEIESIRHVSADNMMRVLLDRKFIKEVGKKDIPGKPVTYGTTKEFLEFFHLQSIADLPQLDEKESERFELAR